MHNSLILGWLLLGSILLCACSKEEYDTRLNSGRQIVLGCSGLWQGETRAVTSNDFCQNIWLAGAYYMDEWSTEVCTPNFMYNQQAVLTASKTGYAFVDDAVWYWPNSGKLRFLPMAPTIRLAATSQHQAHQVLRNSLIQYRIPVMDNTIYSMLAHQNSNVL